MFPLIEDQWRHKVKRISDQRKRQYIDDYLSASVSQDDFCKQNGIGLSSLQRWLRTYSVPGRDDRIKACGRKNKDRFVEAVVTDSAKVQLIHHRQMLTIRTPGGFVIEVPL
jgi:transposase-like protein